MHNTFKDLVYPGTNVRYRADGGDVAMLVDTVAREESAGLVVMGLTGKTKLEQFFSGNDTARISDESHYPLLLVPETAVFAPLEGIVFACDLGAIKGKPALGNTPKAL